MHSRGELVRDLRSLDVKRGDVVMLHASVRAVGEVAGGPDEIHLAIKEVLTDDGTLMMYVGCPRYYDEVGRGNLTVEEEREVLDKLPAFDPHTARAARDHGILAEFFRNYPGTVVNQHVTRFAAWGKEAGFLFSRQPWDFAFGRESALDRLVRLDGRILLVGSDHDTVTFLHYVEHIADIPDKRVTRFRVPVLESGNRVWREAAECDSNVAHPNWPDGFFRIIVDDYLRASGNEGGKVGDALSFVIPARELLEFAQPVMERVARTSPDETGAGAGSYAGYSKPLGNDWTARPRR